VLNIGITIFFHELLKFSEEIAFAIALLIIFVLNFILFRFFIFEDSFTPLSAQFINYSLFAAGFRLSEYLVFLFFHTFIGIDYKLVTTCTLVISSITKYFAYRFLFNKPSINKSIRSNLN
jgi:hypothetical protein